MGLDNSQLSAYQKCPRAYKHQYRDGLVSKNEHDGQDIMAFGSAFHKYLEMRKDGKDGQQVISNYSYKGEEAKLKPIALQCLCEGYEKKYNDEWEVVDNEAVIELNIKGFVFVVKVDTIVKWHNNYFGLEHKTTGALSEYYFEKYKYDAQITAQVYAIRERYGKCAGVFVDACEYQALKRKPRSDKYFTVTPWMDRIYTTQYCRDLFNRTDEELDAWEQNTVHWANRLSSDTEYPMCSSLGFNCARCRYNSICKHPKDEDVLNEYAVVDPFAYLKE